MEHTFSPTHYHTTMGPHEPVLRVHSGDTIRTSTVDARGFDKHRVSASPRGNPQTGPFYIEEAEPGDTLQVQLEEIQPNREYGFCMSSLAPNVVDPNYVNELPPPVIAEWKVDTDAGNARLLSPESNLGELTLPLEPMPGCFGVAPKNGQFFDCSGSAEHGGNMDYRGFVAGTTVYLAVFEPGAYFFIGDGHALQGDGEICGAGVEISMDVRFTLTVIKDKTIGWPRGENDRWIFTCGNARPLDQALQHATTEMLRWLQQDFGFDAVAANLLLTQCVRYDVGNVFDPDYTMVCKLAKEHLSGR